MRNLKGYVLGPQFGKPGMFPREHVEKKKSRRAMQKASRKINQKRKK